MIAADVPGPAGAEIAAAPSSEQSLAVSFAPPDAVLMPAMLTAAATLDAGGAAADGLARDLIGAIRSAHSGVGGIETLLHAYSLSSKEGLALMILAEALLRVPDPATADRLIEDKLALGGFAAHAEGADSLLVNASAWALGISARIVASGDTPAGILVAAARRLGVPAVPGGHASSHAPHGRSFRPGRNDRRGAQTCVQPRRADLPLLVRHARRRSPHRGDAESYRGRYATAIDAIGRAAGNAPLPDRPGISVKLSALHPRYEPRSASA